MTGGSSSAFPVVAEIDFQDDVMFLTDDIPDSAIVYKDVGESNYDKQVNDLLGKYDMFQGIGKTDLVEHHIVTTDNVPVNLPSYRLPMHLKSKATDVIDKYLDEDIISPSKSEFSSPVILVKKQECDDVRVTIDYRALNAKSKKDAFTSPRIDDIIDKLNGADTFSKLDLKASYHHIPVAAEDRHKTAFRFEGKLYEFNRTPFGLSSALATYNRLMSQILGKMSHFCCSYYDDVIIFYKGKDNHYEHINEVLHALYSAGLKLSQNKCTFFANKVDFLGFSISKNSVSVSERKVATIKNYPVPKTNKDVTKFLGLARFYDKLIPNFALVSSPLNYMMCKGSKFNWTEQCNNAFESLKTALCSSPVMSIDDPDWKFIVKVDSCKTGVGCILEEENPIKKERTVIENASQKYNDTQQRYPAIELEVCGLLFAIKHWKQYLIGKHFVVETGSKAVEWIKGKRDLIGKLGRWSIWFFNCSCPW